jgi:hypothetical protein
MGNESNGSSGEIGFCGMLTILFVGLKLGKVITWPWLWVLSPMWIPMAMGVVVMLVVGVGWLVVKLVGK